MYFSSPMGCANLCSRKLPDSVCANSAEVKSRTTRQVSRRRILTRQFRAFFFWGVFAPIPWPLVPLSIDYETSYLTLILRRARKFEPFAVHALAESLCAPGCKETKALMELPEACQIRFPLS